MTWQQPQIMLDNCDLIAEANAAWRALVGWSSTHDPTPTIAARGPVLVKMVGGDLVPISEVGMREMLAYAARFGTSTQNNPFVPKLPPLDHVRVILDRDAAGEYDGASFRSVEFVTDAPILIPSGDGGTVISERGLHDSGVWYDPNPSLASVDRFVNTDEVNVIAARDFLLEMLLGDFDFADDASRANALSLVLLPFVREFIGDVPTPLYAVMAPQPGSGKTTLVETCLSPGLGKVAISAEPRDDEELRKKITSELIAGSRVLFFDNLSHKFASTTLAAALTSSDWTDRVLGKSTVINMPNKLIWVATGNNVDPTGELRDRICLIHLESPDGTPARKRPRSSWRVADIKKWTQTNRAQIVGSCMTLILHWLEQDPDDIAGIPTMGSFDRWAEIMGGILHCSSVPGFLENRDKLDAIDLDEQETTLFFMQVAEWADDGEFFTREIAAECQVGGRFYEFIPNSVGPLSGGHPGHRLGRWLSHHRDAAYGGYRLRMRTANGGLAAWRVERLAE